VYTNCFLRFMILLAIVVLILCCLVMGADVRFEVCDGGTG
jgi:hypothetical protein